MKMNYRASALLVLLVCVSVLGPKVACAAWETGNSYTNSSGMKLIRIETGTFQMGSDLPRDHWDERPIHKVTIGKPFYMSETEVTVEQFQQFRPDFQPTAGAAPYAAGLSWYDAVQFCKWLSNKERMPYRLPTEAEWEYACRAGTTTLFSAGKEAPAPETANPWGLRNMHTGVREWCFDWYGEYPAEDHVDPVGPVSGMAKVVRGGALDDGSRDAQRKTFNASSCRASIAPSFGPYEHPSKNDKDPRPGAHLIGFRVVQAPMPTTRPWLERASYAKQGIKKNAGLTKISPPKDKPYFRKRYLLPTPLENSKNEEIDAVGMHPSFRRHNHSPGLEVCPNGDVMMVIYTSYREYEPGVSLIAARLRFGTDQWDMPDRLFDFAAVNDHCPLLWTDGDTMNFFWGNPKLEGGFPFQWMSSQDSGASWSQVQFPRFVGKIGPHSRQPINTILRDKNGAIYVSSDGSGGRSVLWASPARPWAQGLRRVGASKDQGRTWYDTGGRTGGRHTTFALLEDGLTILGMGGKNTNIDGFMPKSISHDGGKTWDVTRTPFAAQGSNQRPSIVRLQSGRLFFAGDFQHISGDQPEGATERGSYVALSEDEGKTWHIKKLIGTQPHESRRRHGGADTIGYSAARQAPNGLIHLITTMNRPCLHLVFNEAWILAKRSKYEDMSSAELMQPSATRISKLKKFEKRYANGTRATWSGGVADNGRFLLDGTEEWRYRNSQKQYEVTYKLGRKAGKETYWAPDGTVKWEWEHRDDGTSQWTQWWSAGNPQDASQRRKKAESTWRNFKCNGTARLWDPAGQLISEKNFTDGKFAD